MCGFVVHLCAHAVCRGVGLVWAWFGFAVGLVSVQSGRGLGSVWARSGFGVGLVCACCLPWCGFGVGSVWVGCGFGRVSEHPSFGPKLDRRKMHTKPTPNPEIEIRGLARTRGARNHGHLFTTGGRRGATWGAELLAAAAQKSRQPAQISWHLPNSLPKILAAVRKAATSFGQPALNSRIQKSESLSSEFCKGTAKCQSFT